MRKHWLVTAVVLVACGFVPLAGQEGEAQYYADSYARLSYVRGDVYVQRTSDLGFEKGEVNLALTQGDKLGTRDGQAEIALGRRTYLRLDTDSQVEFTAMPLRDGDLLKVSLLAGSAYLRVAVLSDEKKVEVHSPDASFYILAEGLYRFDVRDGAETEVFVVSGELEAAGEEGSSVVKSSERLVAANGAFQGEPEYGRAVSDDFERWNASRDEPLTARRSSSSSSSGTRYLPTGLEEYEDELADNGRWTYEQPYGYVWVPRVAYDDWRPYYYGRWVWYPIIGWTWVSSEPWGWSVYHYGRWHWRNSLGWYWIPTRHWGPAWVNWHWDSHHVGWSPLSWYNRPGVIMGGRYHDRYRERDFPYDNRAMTVIRRSDLQERNVGRVALRGDALRSVGRISLRAEQPALRPVADRTSPEALTAKKLFSQAPRSVGETHINRGSIRSFSRDAGSGGAAAPLNSSRLSSERLRSGGFKSAPADRAETNARGGTVFRRSSVSPERNGSSTNPVTPRSGSFRADPDVRVYPSRRGGNSPSASSSEPRFRSSGAGGRLDINKSPSARSSSSGGVRAYPSREGVSRSSAGERRSFSSSDGPREPRAYSSRIRGGEAGSESRSLNSRTYESRPSIRSSDRARSSWSGLGSLFRGRETTPRSSAPEIRESYSRSNSSGSYSDSRAPSSRSFSSPRSSSSSRSSSPSYSAPSSSRSSSSRSSSSRSSSPSGSSSSSGRIHRKG